MSRTGPAPPTPTGLSKSNSPSLQLADAGQALAERVEAVGLGLQLAQARGQGVDFALGVVAGGVELRLLRCDLLLQRGVVGEADADAAQPAPSATAGASSTAMRRCRGGAERPCGPACAMSRAACRAILLTMRLIGHMSDV